MNAWVLVGIGVNVSMALMAVVWFICKKLNNAGFVDVAWSYGFALVAVLYAVAGEGNPLRTGLITGMAVSWSLRLGTHLLIRVAGHHPVEDARYAALREAFPKRVWLMFFGFFLLQGLLIGILSAPFAVASANPAPGLGVFEIFGVLLWLAALGGEALADGQLKRFRADPENKGRVCNTGLWKYSRHPNYFFEWVIWIAFFVFACGSPGGWMTVFCPLVMLHFLLNVTGVPPAEEQSLKSRGDAYREYQRTTSVFLPLPPKKS
jgi:steroid 5-alpha reductase family enzyme